MYGGRNGDAKLRVVPRMTVATGMAPPSPAGRPVRRVPALAAAASAAAKPIDDKRGTKDFRIKVAGVLARRAAVIALERAGQS